MQFDTQKEEGSHEDKMDKSDKIDKSHFAPLNYEPIFTLALKIEIFPIWSFNYWFFSFKGRNPGLLKIVVQTTPAGEEIQYSAIGPSGSCHMKKV